MLVTRAAQFPIPLICTFLTDTSKTNNHVTVRQQWNHHRVEIYGHKILHRQNRSMWFETTWNFFLILQVDKGRKCECEKCGWQSIIQVLVELKCRVHCCAAFAIAVYGLVGEGCTFFLPDQRKMQSHSRAALVCQGLYVCVPIGVGCFWADACAHLASKKQRKAPLGVRRRRQIDSQSRSLAIAQTLNKNF